MARTGEKEQPAQADRRSPTSPVPLPTSRRGMLRYRLLPRSVIGISMLILAFAIGSGFSGVVLYSYYQFKLSQTNDKVNSFISGYKSAFAKAEADLAASTAADRAQIAAETKGVQALQAGPSQIAALVTKVAPSMFFVHTLDASGQPSVGSAFVVASTTTSSLLLTSYTTVAAATRSPGPQVYVSTGDQGTQAPVTVRTWDPQYDLALLVLPRGGLPALPAAPVSPAPQPGDRLFAVSGLGTPGAALSQGSVVDVSAGGLALAAPVGPAFQGGPVINDAGQVVAVGSRAYAPLGFASDGVYFVPFLEDACARVLSCPGGSLVGSQ
jgi:S1-C subfamily serine protease